MHRFVSADGVVYYDHHEARENGNGYETEPSERQNAREASSWVFYPTEVTDYGNQVQHTHRGCIVPPRPTAATTFTGFVEKLSKPRRRLLAGLKLVHDDATYWIRHQRENKGLLVSATDGSAPEDSTFGWVLALPDGTALVECNGPADGAPADQMSSGRAETAGVQSLGQFFHAAAEYLEINPTGHCRNYIDSTAALRRAQRSSQPQRLLRSRISSDMDLTTAYRHLGKHIYGYILTRWVKGHQDRYLAYNKLSTQAKMKCALTNWLKNTEPTTKDRPDPPRSQNRTPKPSQANAYNSLSMDLLSLNLMQNGYDTRSQATICGNTSRSAMTGMILLGTPSTGWHGFEKAIRSRPPIMQRCISKFVNGWWNVGKQCRRINTKDFILCPRCKLCRETTEHVLYCSRLSPETQKFRATVKDTINSVTPETITGMILSILRRLSVEPHNSPRPRIPETLPPEVGNELRKAIQEQAAIGWSLTLQGYLAKSCG
jgi:hypothetical protein